MIADTEDLLDSLKFSYLEYKECKSKDNRVNTAYKQGYCIALEDILEVSFKVPSHKIIEMRKLILGDVTLDRIHTCNISDILKIVEI